MPCANLERMETPIIHTRGLTKTYGKTDVVHDLNLEVQPGVVHGLSLIHI